VKGFLILSNSEDGDVQLRHVTEAQLKQELRDGDLGDCFLSASDVKDHQGEGAWSSWDFANFGARGVLILRADAVVTPKPKETVTEWEV
jgi:hypothetical protein